MLTGTEAPAATRKRDEAPVPAPGARCFGSEAMIGLAHDGGGACRGTHTE